MNTRAMGHIYTDCLVVGTGVAGMRAALEASVAGHVIVISKEAIKESNSFYAQGGIAAVLNKEDSLDSHIKDTMTTGCGLCDEFIVKKVVTQGPKQIEQLDNWKTPFDKTDGVIKAGREGGHSHFRIAHALGDATGKAIVLSLMDQIKQRKAIKVFDNCFVVDFLTVDNVCYGVVCYHKKYGLQCIWATKTILASGGAGRLFRETTNPPGATGDGLAAAWRAGAVLSDMEFVQFHPTTLYVAGATRILITEAIRGEGGILVDANHHPFMSEYHEMKDLAPRDIVSRAIYAQLAKTNRTCVYLDVRHLDQTWFAQRFPTISQVCRSFDIDTSKDLIPVRPSAHYMIGGVKTDVNGCTSLENLYCCGEASASGLHGANRLASNSLLEAMVFGYSTGRHAYKQIKANTTGPHFQTIISKIPYSSRTELDIGDITHSLRSVMSRTVGVLRSEAKLKETIEIIDFWQSYILDKVFDSVKGWECQNMLTISKLIAQQALLRQESRGVHFRSDFPEPNEILCHHLDITSN